MKISKLSALPAGIMLMIAQVQGSAQGAQLAIGGQQDIHIPDDGAELRVAQEQIQAYQRQERDVRRQLGGDESQPLGTVAKRVRANLNALQEQLSDFQNQVSSARYWLDVPASQSLSHASEDTYKELLRLRDLERDVRRQLGGDERQPLGQVAEAIHDELKQLRRLERDVRSAVGVVSGQSTLDGVKSSQADYRIVEDELRASRLQVSLVCTWLYMDEKGNLEQQAMGIDEELKRLHSMEALGSEELREYPGQSLVD
jgi:hypothetical protein